MTDSTLFNRLSRESALIKGSPFEFRHSNEDHHLIGEALGAPVSPAGLAGSSPYSAREDHQHYYNGNGVFMSSGAGIITVSFGITIDPKPTVIFLSSFSNAWLGAHFITTITTTQFTATVYDSAGATINSTNISTYWLAL